MPVNYPQVVVSLPSWNSTGWPLGKRRSLPAGALAGPREPPHCCGPRRPWGLIRRASRNSRMASETGPFKGVGSGQPGMALQGPGIQGQGLPIGSQGLVKIASLLLGASEGQMELGIILAIPSRPSGSGEGLIPSSGPFLFNSQLIMRHGKIPGIGVGLEKGIEEQQEKGGCKKLPGNGELPTIWWPLNSMEAPKGIRAAPPGPVTGGEQKKDHRKSLTNQEIIKQGEGRVPGDGGRERPIRARASSRPKGINLV